MSYESELEDWEESIFFNKFALFSLIAIVIWAFISLYLFYTWEKTNIMSFRNLWISWDVKIINKQEFIEKVNTKWLEDIVKSLEQISDWNIKLCKDTFCTWLLPKINLTYKADVELEREVFKSLLIEYFWITESQFNSQFKFLTWNTFLLKDKYFNPSFYKFVILEDNSHYYIVLTEQFEQKEQLLLGKEEFIKDITSNIKSLGLISSLESKAKTDLFVEISDNLIKAFNYSLIYEIKKEDTVNSSSWTRFLLLYGPKDYNITTIKNKSLVDVLQDPNIKLDKFNEELNKLFIRNTIEQLFEKSAVLIRDLLSTRESQKKKLEDNKSSIITPTIITTDTSKIIKDTTPEISPKVNSTTINSLNN